MLAFEELLRPTTLLDLIGPRVGRLTGLQGAHLIGDKLWLDNLGFLDDLGFGIGRNNIGNGSLAPETGRGGYALGVSVHNGQQRGSFDRLQFSTSNLSGPKFLNQIREKLISAETIEFPDDPIGLENAKRTLAREVYIYERYLELSNLHQDVLDRAGFGDTKALVYNEADARSGTRAFGGLGVDSYLESPDVASSQNYDQVKGTALWARISENVPDGLDFDATNVDFDLAVRDRLLTAIPDYSRMYFPEGIERMPPSVRADVLVRDHIYARSVINGQFDANRFELELRSSETVTLREEARRRIIELEARGEGLGRATSYTDLERRYVRTFRSDIDVDRMIAAQGADAAITRRTLDAMPDDVRGATRRLLDKFDAYKNGLGGINAKRLALGVGGALVATLTLWTEAEKRGGFTSPDFIAWAKEEAKSALIAAPIVGGALYAASLTPLGPVVFVSLGAVAIYSSLSTIFQNLEEIYRAAEGEAPGTFYPYIKEASDWFKSFEAQISSAIETATNTIGRFFEDAVRVLEELVMDSIQFAGGESVALTDEGNGLLIGDDQALLLGDAQNNWLIHRGSGEVYGEAGHDTLIGWKPDFIKAGDPLDPTKPDGATADQDYRLLLDGGAGNDWVFALGGTGAITVGGEGRDFLYNSSYKGQLWGDGLDGRGASNSGAGTDDTFWWSAGSFIMDAGKNDRLQLFGLPLVGGSNALYYGIGLEKAVARDFLLPWVTYGKTQSGQLLVEASFGRNLNPALGEDAILEIAQVVEGWDPGDLGIHFTVKGGDDRISLFKAVFQVLGAQAAAVKRFAKNVTWLPSDDPLDMPTVRISSGCSGLVAANDNECIEQEVA